MLLLLSVFAFGHTEFQGDSFSDYMLGFSLLTLFFYLKTAMVKQPQKTL